MVKIMLDAGHGGKDPGAVSKFGNEEDWTLKISLYQYNRFKELGVSVGLTRDSDETLTENQRVSLVQQGEYCFSNHLNAGGGDRAEVIHSIYDDGKLASAIKTQLLAAGQTSVKVYCRKGVSGDYYYMHRRTGATRTNIIEYSFIDNEADFKHFKDNWEAYAEAPVKAFCSHIGHPYKTKEVITNTAPVASPAAPSPQGIGTLKVIENTVIRDRAVYLGNITGNVKPDEEYIVHDYDNGWFNIGGWVYKDYVQFIPHNDTKISR
jgi:N-acetylmuramoyl-L-alanine amidase